MGRLRTQRDIARWEAEASEEDRQNTALLVIGDTITQYWNLAYLNQSIATGQANLERLERTRELVQARFDAGAVSRPKCAGRCRTCSRSARRRARWNSSGWKCAMH